MYLSCCIVTVHCILYCLGDAVESESCNDHPCFADGEWITWNRWQACSATCDDGVQVRTRDCDGPYGGGDACEGHSSEEQACSSGTCPLGNNYFTVVLNHLCSAIKACYGKDSVCFVNYCHTLLSTMLFNFPVSFNFVMMVNNCIDCFIHWSVLLSSDVSAHPGASEHAYDRCLDNCRNQHRVPVSRE